MHTHLILIGNPQGIILPKKLLQQYHLAGEVDLQPAPEGLLITSIARPARQDRDAQMQAALAAGQEPEDELLEGFTDNNLEEWQW